MKCNLLLKEAIDGSIVSPEERVALNAAKPKAVSAIGLEEAYKNLKGAESGLQE